MKSTHLTLFWPSLPGRAVQLVIAAACGIASLLTALLLVLTIGASPTLGARDIAVYWATAQQLNHHENPYDPAGLAASEHAAGVPRTAGTMYTRNPPLVLPFVFMLSPFSFRLATTAWTIILLGCLLLSIELLRRSVARPFSERVLLVYLFAPALICIINGQTAAISLLGLTLFLRFQKTNSFIAGAGLALCALKPHLFISFGIVVLLEAMTRRTWILFAGLAAALAAEITATLFLAPHAWSQYARMLSGSGIQDDVIPCVSYAVRNLIAPQLKWLQYVPAAVACLWAAPYFRKHRNAWNWHTHGSMVILISVLVAPYCWLYDLILLIPVALYGVYAARSRGVLLALAVFNTAIELALILNAWKPASVYLWTVWAGPALLLWYWLIQRNSSWTRDWPGGADQALIEVS